MDNVWILYYFHRISKDFFLKTKIYKVYYVQVFQFISNYLSIKKF